MAQHEEASSKQKATLEDAEKVQSLLVTQNELTSELKTSLAKMD